MIKIKKYETFLVVFALLACITFLHTANAMTLCGVILSYPGANITTNNSPCLTVNSVTINGSGITSSYLSTDELKTYNLNSLTPIESTWQNQTSSYSQWLVTTPNHDTGMTVSNSILGSVYLNYIDAPSFWSYDTNTSLNTISVDNSKQIQLYFNPPVPVVNPPPAFASTTTFNTNPIQVSWSTIPINSQMVVADVNQDGMGDLIYTHTGNTLFTKQFGTGASSFNISNGDDRAALAVHMNRMLAWYQPHLTINCPDIISTQYNLLTGANMSATQLGSVGAGGVQTGVVGIINLHNQTGLVCLRTSPFVDLTVHDTPNVNQSDFGAGSASISSGPYDMQLTTTGATQAYLYDNTLWKNSTATASNYFVKDVTNNVLRNTNLPLPSNVVFDNKIQTYKNNLRYPAQSLLTFARMSQLLSTPSFSNNMTLIVNTPPIILDPAFTSQPTYFLINDGSTTYVAAIVGTNLYYTPYNALVTQLTTNRAYANYIIDPADQFLHLAINGSLSAFPNITLFNLNSTSYTYPAPEQTVLVSGYYWQVPTQSRYYYPELTNSLAQIPTDTFTSANSLWTYSISNAPILGAIMFSNSSNYNGTHAYTNSINYIQVDKTTTVSLVNNACYNVYVEDSSLTVLGWVFQGTSCASGANPKTIAYTTTLPLTFWTQTWGATDTYVPATETLTTVVRHNTAPYSYTVVVYNSTGVPAFSQTFSSSSVADTKSFNVTGITKPASLAIFGDGQQIYTAYLGSPLSLAVAASFFHQYFNYQGFDLLAIIPLVFAGMFTRNTVGIGASLTVVCIATLSWLSIVVIPDVTIGILVIISCIGLIGYRSLYG